ncbi:uncharacterized protein LOC121737124 isoform X2 [Aricia agestis]|uniref:uncharacterized protein LOC121737124 isoform X2 n=1 Tax=Aricia agestis TaxID=91739 RepID=UPI001C202080|nr:uncharacterized protein LOC121737124 isoform X2 [Aricia agestis]
MIKSIFLLALIGYTSSSVPVEPSDTFPVETTVSDGVRSLGFNVIYGDEDMTVINQVVKEANVDMRSKVNLDQELPRLPVEDVKCLMSVDRYCSKEMLQMKKILIQALQEDCSRCSSEDKERAGRVIAAMMAHDPVAWKLFLTRYDSLERMQRILG